MNISIDADDMIKDLEGYMVDPQKAVSEDESYINGYNAGLHTSICAVVEAKSMRGVPVMHGHWEERYIEDAPIFFRNKVYCSICESWATYGKTKYCPHCGALMDEVTE